MPLPKWELATSEEAICTLCGSRNRVRVFPVTFAQQNAPALPEGAAEGEAACFDHPNKKAVAACQQCGRFVCQLCAVQFGAETWCPSCVSTGTGKAKAANTETTRTLYDSVALTLPLASLIVWPLTILAAPATLALTLLKWRQPLSLVRRFRWRFVVGAAVAFVESGLWGWGLVYLLTQAGKQQ
jgi:hypothetical protein